jgi:hypothetical protein
VRYAPGQMASPPVLTDPVVAAVCRHPRPGELVWRFGLVFVVAALYQLDARHSVGTPAARVLAWFFLVPQAIGMVRALLGFARRDRRLAGPLGWIDVFVVNELRRVVRSFRAAFRVRATQVTGKIREWDGGDGPMILMDDAGQELWVDAGLTHTRIFTPSTPRVGDRVQVLGDATPDRSAGAFRDDPRRRLEPPITIIAPTWRPFPWILADAVLAGVAVLGYAAAIVLPLL